MDIKVTAKFWLEYHWKKVGILERARRGGLENTLIILVPQCMPFTGRIWVTEAIKR
jgi:hypothetical protein